MSRADFLRALEDLPARHRAWLEDGDIDLWAYYGLGVLLTDPQREHLNDLLTWPPGTVHVWRWANRTGKTTGLDIGHGWMNWYKWRYTAAEFDDWFAYRYKTLHSAPLGELAGKAVELWEELLAGSAMQQRDPLNQRQRPALLAPFFAVTKDVDATGVDRPAVHCANGAKIDFRSTQGKAARLESDSWWFIDWDEFPRQLPPEDITDIFDQTMLARSSDFMAPIVLSGTATIASEHIYQELEELSEANPSDWNFTQAARSTNYSQSAESIDRQRRLSINKDVAARSLDGSLGGGASSLFPPFLLANAFTNELPEVTKPPTDGKAWEAFARLRTFFTTLDHALAHDDNVLITVDSPWPPLTISPTNPIVGNHMEIIRSSRTLTGDELHAYASRETRGYRSRALIIDGTGPGGLHVFRKARADGLPAVNCNLQGREVKWVTNKEAGLQGLQRLLSWGLPVDATEGFINEWPRPEGPFGLLRFPNTGPWLKLRRQLAVLRRADEAQRQDAAMALVQLAWYLWKLVGHAAAPRTQPFNIVAGTRRRRWTLARR